ncbi:MAG: hypothetical protein FK733_19590, partial [Asgard group archaeon]|nr:hypothetical protein [Asgard group archaeon]
MKKINKILIILLLLSSSIFLHTKKISAKERESSEQDILLPEAMGVVQRWMTSIMTMDNYYSSPVAGDFTNNGDIEIVMVVPAIAGSWVYLFNLDGDRFDLDY